MVRPPERGSLRIAERVVAKLAAQAAREALRAAPQASQVPPGRARKPYASVSVRRHPGPDGTGGMARVRIAVELGYPSDIGAQCGAVRSRVTERLGELAGMDVPDVGVEVERLHSAHADDDSGGRVG
ncbi:Asp23/Gls24 family envelope stress response protein [Streptomyces sp. ACA25]|uniref:Asp23/Gls24 family envelope stress response protein n=1 Tax=Streptomyces sp. ACA25 TaxID=3022596 RepID=UPI003FA7DDC2